MIDPITIRCDLCRSTDDVAEAGIGARRGHLCGPCKRTLYSIADGVSDPSLPTRETRDGCAAVCLLWEAARLRQTQLDAEVQAHHDAVAQARNALEIERAVANEAERVRLEVEAEHANAVATALWAKLDAPSRTRVALAGLIDGTATPHERELFATLLLEEPKALAGSKVK